MPSRRHRPDLAADDRREWEEEDGEACGGGPVHGASAAGRDSRGSAAHTQGRETAAAGRTAEHGAAGWRKYILLSTVRRPVLFVHRSAATPGGHFTSQTCAHRRRNLKQVSGLSVSTRDPNPYHKTNSTP